MWNNKQSYYKIILLILFFGFTFNFIWESIHAKFLYSGILLDKVNYWFLMGYASAIDSFLIVLMYLTTAILIKTSLWVNDLNKFRVLIFSFLGLIIAIFIEYLNVYLLHRWSYTNLMPTLFGIGFSPLIQLSITGLVTLYVVRGIYGRNNLSKKSLLIQKTF